MSETHTQRHETGAMSADEYDAGWRQWSDFIRYNPGARHRRRLTLEILRSIDFRSVLDIGCGNAELLGTFHSQWPDRQLSGADLSPEVIERNRRHLPGIRFHVLNIQETALPEKYDLVTCSEVVEHLADQRSGMKHLASMVHPGGHLLVTCPTGTVYATEREFGHVSHPALEDIRKYAQEQGLEVVRAWNWGWPLYKTIKWATNVNPKWSLKHFASERYSPLAKLVSGVLYYANFANLKGAHGCQLFILMRKVP